MAPAPLASLPRAAAWTCRQCQLRSKRLPSPTPLRATLPARSLSTYTALRSNLEIQGDGVPSTGPEITAAAPIDFSKSIGRPARVIPASASYFTTSPEFNDHVLRLIKLVRDHESLPTVAADKAPRIAFMSLAQFRGMIDEKVGAAKYSKLLGHLKRLNQIDPTLRPGTVQKVLEEFRRPGSAEIIPPRPKFIDQYGRAKGVGRRKSSVARVQLVEGNGEILINGKTISQAFPRLHDRESAVWPLKVTNRLDKYNVFVVTSGGGLTGQAESITLGMANALLVHEPALKPTLRKAGCVTRIMKRVERKKTGRVKARKRPAWVKR